MYYWRDSNYRGLLDVAEAAEQWPRLARYAEYCRLREQGLRKPAFQAIRTFIAEAQGWPLAERTEFVDWILTIAFHEREIYDLIPHPLRQDLIEPTLREWRSSEPDHPAPYRWSAPGPDLLRAIELDPHEQIARLRYLDSLAERVNYGAHELPYGAPYLGDPDQDLGDVIRGELLARGIIDDARRSEFLEYLQSRRALLESYREYLDLRSGASFADWAHSEGRPVE